MEFLHEGERERESRIQFLLTNSDSMKSTCNSLLLRTMVEDGYTQKQVVKKNLS